MAKKIEIKLTSAVVIGGKIKTRGSVVTVDEKLATNLLQRGKANLHDTIIAPIAGTFDGEDVEDAPLDDHTVPELKEIAAQYEIDGVASMNKAQLIEAIQAAEEGDAADEKGGE